jgi:hypothetical protein
MQSIEDRGIPLSRRLLDAFTPHVRGQSSWSGFASQFVLVTIAALAYFGVRLLTKGAEAAAFDNARALLEFEQRVHLQIEQWAQEQILDSEALVTFFNWVYIWLHWPVILGALIFLYRFDTRGYVLFRNSLFVSGAMGLLLYVSFPVAPPRFLDGFTDTVAELSTSYRFLQPPAVVNKYAAMPSLHVGWNILAGVILFTVLRHRILRFFALLSPVLMVLAVVLTANHYVIDALVGAAVAGLGLWGGVWLTRWTEERAARLRTLSDG